uniref:Uncharacterized protein n=1 Tax=Timema monikensis TaxID=170555 RepID=A0A7R9HR24_9NEOP|nr:unnamed protein product [Timema monikensis]
MQKNLLLPAKAKGLKRLNQKLFVTATTLDSYVTEKTANIFDVLLDNGMKMAGESFLLKEPSLEDHALTAQAASTTFCPEPSPILLYTQLLEISGHIVTPFCSGSPPKVFDVHICCP